MMRKLIAAVVMSGVSLVSMSGAQKFEIGIDGGYALGIGDSVGKNCTLDPLFNPLSWEDVYGSQGNGWKIRGEVTCWINDGFGVMAMSGYSWGGGYSTKQKFSSYSISTTVTTSYVPVNLGIKLRSPAMGPIRPYIYVAPGIYFPKKRQKDYNTSLAANPPPNVTDFKYSLGFGFTAGVGAVCSLNDRMGIKLDIAPTYAFANVTQFTYGDPYANPKTKTYIYKNDTPNLPQSTPETIYLNGQPRHRFISVAAQLGMTYTF
jgi:hypothetical protein